MEAKGMIHVKELKEILKKYNDDDTISLCITEFDEEDATAELCIYKDYNGFSTKKLL